VLHLKCILHLFLGSLFIYSSYHHFQ